MRFGHWILGVGLVLGLGGGLAGSSGEARAQDTPMSDVNCDTAETQAELDTCASLDFQAADSDLDAAYRAAMARLQAIDEALPQDEQGAVAALVAAEQAWIAFRDQACAAEGFTVHGGSMEPMVVMECRTRLSAARAEDLWSLSESASDP